MAVSVILAWQCGQRGHSRELRRFPDFEDCGSGMSRSPGQSGAQNTIRELHSLDRYGGLCHGKIAGAVLYGTVPTVFLLFCSEHPA